jgi:hypothetical protein
MTLLAGVGGLRVKKSATAAKAGFISVQHGTAEAVPLQEMNEQVFTGLLQFGGAGRYSR